MKILMISLVAILLSHMANSQDCGPFNKTFYYYGDSLSTLNSIEGIVSDDSNYYLSLVIVDKANGQNLAIVKTTKDGNLAKMSILQDTIWGLLITYQKAIIIDRSGDIVIASNKSIQCISNGDFFIVKLNKDLDTLWTRVYDLPATAAGYPQDTILLNFATAIKQTPDGGYIVTGNYRRIPQGTIDDRACLLKIDTDGNVQWWRAYPNVLNAYAIEITADSGFLLPTGKEPRGYKIIRLDKTGAFLSEIILDNLKIHRVGQDLKFLDDSIVIVAGQYIFDESIGSNYPNALDLFKVNIYKQQVVWEQQYRIYQNFKSVELHQSFSLNIINDKGIVICGTARVYNSDSATGGYKGFIFKLTNDGDSLWSHYYGYGGFRDDCQFNDVLLTDDGGFLAAGWHFPWDGSYNAGAWLVKTDSLGYAPGSTPTGLEKPPALVSSFNIYPNPATGHTWIALDDTGQAATLNLLDLSGRVVSSHSLPRHDNEYQLDTSKLKSGIYLVSLIYESGQVVTTKLVVR